MDIREGDSIPRRHCPPVTRMAIARCSVAIADPNLVHIDEAAARDAGLDNVIASGALLAGIMGDTVTGWAGIGSIVSCSSTLSAPLYPGTAVTVSGRVVEAGPVVASVELEATDQDGRRLARGHYVVKVPCGPSEPGTGAS